MERVALRLDDKQKYTNDSPEMRAWRLKRIRNLANLSREQMCANSEINRNTLISWENARFGGLTVNGAIKALEKVTQEGVYCTLEWLMHGVEPGPSVNPALVMPDNNLIKLDDETVIAYELAVFRTKNLNAVDMIVNDDGMLPQYQVSDYVAGKKKKGSDIQSVIGRDSIVQLDTGETLLRSVREGQDDSTYTLVCNNPHIKKRSSIILNAKLLYAAPVIWHRKKE